LGERKEKKRINKKGKADDQEEAAVHNFTNRKSKERGSERENSRHTKGAHSRSCRRYN